jgi:hypothetical protein
MLAMASGGYLAIGDVHGISRTEIPALRAALGEMFGCAVVVREPLDRLRSQLALFRQHDFKGWGDLRYVEPIAEAAGIAPVSVSVEQRHFIHGASMLNAILEERELSRIFRSEDLTRDPGVLCELVRELTHGSVSSTLEWAEAAMAISPANRRARSEIPTLGGWEMNILRRCVKPAAWDAYRALGYPAAIF